MSVYVSSIQSSVESTLPSSLSYSASSANGSINIGGNYYQDLLSEIEEKFLVTTTIKQDSNELLKLGTIKNPLRFSSSNGRPTLASVEDVSIKIMNRSKLEFDIEQYLLQEVNILRELNHPNVISLVFFSKNPLAYAIIYEFFSGDELIDRIRNRKSYSENRARSWMKSIFSAVKHCHDHNIIHRNINPSNIIFTNNHDDNSIKLVDFGCALEAKGRCIDEYVGVHHYLAPEIVEGRPYGKEVDMWAVGVTLHYLLGGIHPFYHDDQEVTNRKITRAYFDFSSPYWNHVTSLAKELIRNLLVKSPDDRFTMDATLAHEWTVVALPENQNALNVDFFNRNLDNMDEELSPEFLQKYQIDFSQILGKGAYGVVRKGVSKLTKDEVAIKIYDLRNMSPRAQEAISREVEILTELDNPNIVKALDCHKEESLKKTYFVMQLVCGGELFERISKKIRYTEKEARGLVRKLLETIKYIHDHNVAHRDLKPQNLLLTSEATDAEVVVVDFGFAKKCDEDCLKTYCGTLDYMAPEILRCSKAPYGKAVDMWSFGVILYILLGGYSPFTGSKKSIMTNIATGQFEFHSEYWLQVSHSAQDLIKRMLQVDPKKRFTANQALGHEWLKKTDEELDQHQLSKGLQELRKHLIKRKLRAALRVVVATGRLRRGLLSRQSSAMIRIEDLNLDDM